MARADMPAPDNSLLAAGVNVIWRTLGLLPLRVRVLLGRVVGAIYGHLPSRERRIARAQLRWIFPQYPAERLARQVFVEIGQTAGECLNLAPLVAHRPDHAWTSTPSLADLHRTHGAVLALSAHTANWELLAALQAADGVPLTVVGREANRPLLHHQLAALRQRSGVKTVWRGDPGAARALLRTLQQREVVAALVDQDTAVASLAVPFFGHLAMTPSSVIDIAQRQQAHIVSIFLVRPTPSSYAVHLRELPHRASPVEILTEYHRHLEELLRQFPAQWPWFHKRWRTQGGETLSTSRYLAFLEEQCPCPTPRS